MRKDAPGQIEIDFVAAAERAAEQLAQARGRLWHLAESLGPEARQAELLRAAQQAGCGSRECRLLLAVARSAGADLRAVTAWTHRRLAEELGCAARTARRVVERARARSLLRVAAEIDEARDAYVGPNRYAIDWPEVLTIASSARGRPLATFGQPLAKNGQPLATDGQGSRGNCTDTARGRAVGISNSSPGTEENSGPARPGPEPGEIFDWWGNPTLAEAARRRVEPLEPRSLYGGVFEPLEHRHLRQPHSMVEWFRRQLGADRPVTGDTEADLLAVMAAARRAVDPPRGIALRSPVGWFAHVVVRGEWWRVLREVAAARESLDGLLERYGEDLLRGAWPPAREEMRGAGAQGACSPSRPPTPDP